MPSASQTDSLLAFMAARHEILVCNRRIGVQDREGQTLNDNAPSATLWCLKCCGLSVSGAGCPPDLRFRCSLEVWCGWVVGISGLQIECIRFAKTLGGGDLCVVLYQSV